MKLKLDRVKRIWYLSPMRAAKVQASLRIRAVSPEPPLLAHTSSESRETFRQKARCLAPLNGCACAVKICHDGMLEDKSSFDRAQLFYHYVLVIISHIYRSWPVDISIVHSYTLKFHIVLKFMFSSGNTVPQTRRRRGILAGAVDIDQCLCKHSHFDKFGFFCKIHHQYICFIPYEILPNW